MLGFPPPDAEAAALSAARLMGWAPDGLWRYATVDDETLFYQVRWDIPGGRKTVRTLSWDVMDGWCFAAWPGRRPLFGLPAILRRPEAGIVICEGEKAAEAAAIIFPERVATTSSCGAGGASRTDWTPLARRQALIWPDHDAPGAAYGNEVAGILSAMGCTVLLIEPAAIGATMPKWDAANALVQWDDLAALRTAVLAAARPRS